MSGSISSPVDEGPTVLFVVNVSWFFLSHRLPLALAARGLGYQVHVATQVESQKDRNVIRDCGIRLHELQMDRNSQGVLSNLRLAGQFLTLFRGLRPDIVHLVTMKPVLLGGIAARLTGVRAVVSAIPGLGYGFIARGRWAELRRWVLRRGMKVALGHPNSAVIFQNPDDMIAMTQRGVVHAEKCVLIRGAGVDTDAFPFVNERPGKTRVLLASRMLREKGVEVFVEAAQMLRAQGVNAEFLLAGQPDPANPGSIEPGRLQAWNDTGVVRWLGHCEDMISLLQSVHIVCLPSFYGEGVPKVLIEAAAAGRPIVATDMPGCREIVRNGVTGLLVPPRDSKSLAGAIAQLIDDSGLRRRLGRNGRDLAVAEFDLAGVIDRTMGVYAALLNHKTS